MSTAEPGSTVFRDRGALVRAVRTRWGRTGRAGGPFRRLQREAHRPGAGPTAAGGGAETPPGSGLAVRASCNAREKRWIQAEPLLAIEELVVRYGAVRAVRGVSLEVFPGEVVGLIGPNGAGKTSTLAAIFGLVPAASGRILFDGAPLAGLTPEKVVRRGIALVPEGRQVFGTLTVGENLRLGATPRPDRHSLDDDLAQVFALFPVLERYLGASAGRLSGGEQQQLAIGRALLSKPRLLLLDEPSLGLAPLVIDSVFDAIDELRRSGVTVLLVEQNAARTVEFADRTYLLRSGEIALSGTREVLAGKLDLAHAYLGV